MTSLSRHIISLISVVATLQGCITTGIDSTARITDNDVKREIGQPSPEQLFLADIRPQPLSQWKAGKRFWVTDDRLKLLLGASAPQYSIQGDYITFVDCRERSSPTGSAVTDFRFLTTQGDEIIYQSQNSLTDLEHKDNVEIPFTIEESLILDTASRLQGKSYYVLVAERFNADGGNARRAKFIPVTVKKVLPGNMFYPVRILLDETLSGSESSVLMSLPGASSGPNRSFATLFSFTDPRLKYNSVSDKAWANIVNNCVSTDMTREECRLAIGPPATVDRYNTGSFLIEVWTYENGAFLRFEDGILKDFRK